MDSKVSVRMYKRVDFMYERVDFMYERVKTRL